MWKARKARITLTCSCGAVFERRDGSPAVDWYEAHVDGFAHEQLPAEKEKYEKLLAASQRRQAKKESKLRVRFNELA